jgi:hypothetical protein
MSPHFFSQESPVQTGSISVSLVFSISFVKKYWLREINWHFAGSQIYMKFRSSCDITVRISVLLTQSMLGLPGGGGGYERSRMISL